MSEILEIRIECQGEVYRYTCKGDWLKRILIFEEGVTEPIHSWTPISEINIPEELLEKVKEIF